MMSFTLRSPHKKADVHMNFSNQRMSFFSHLHYMNCEQTSYVLKAFALSINKSEVESSTIHKRWGAPC